MQSYHQYGIIHIIGSLIVGYMDTVEVDKLFVKISHTHALILLQPHGRFP